MLNIHHVQGLDCPSCNLKLTQAVPYLRIWFKRKKAQYPSLHISWSYRDKESQEQAYTEGKTRAHFPNSPHNRVNPTTGDPESNALDLFELNGDGKAIFNPIFYARLADEVAKDEDSIIWGGHFRSISDLDHFQYNPDRFT